MITWVLLIIITANHGNAITSSTIPGYSSKEACNVVADALLEDYVKHPVTQGHIRVICLPQK